MPRLCSSFRTLLAAASSDAVSSSRTSGRGLANVDRYSTIRTFFTTTKVVDWSLPRYGIPRPTPIYKATKWNGLHAPVRITFRTYASGKGGHREETRRQVESLKRAEAELPEESRKTGTNAAQPDHTDTPDENSQSAYTSAQSQQGHTTNGGDTPDGQQPNTLPDPSSTRSQVLQSYASFYRRLALSLPHVHRPTRDDLLRAASNFWQRLRIRFKWFTIRSFRPFNADDISGFVTLLIMSQTVWILVGTTTFFSVVFATANSLRLQEYIARGISDYLTAETGITVVFESAIVPKWKDSRLSFRNVYVSRRPSPSAAQMQPSAGASKKTGHLTAVGYDVSTHPAYNNYHDQDEEDVLPDLHEEDTNYTMFDLNVDSIDVELSLPHWLDGKGLVKDAVVKGVRGVVDRRSVHWDPDHPLDPADYRHVARPGDFELESLQLEDVLVTVHQPGGFRPYTVSIFRADLHQLRKQWIFYDFLSADNIVGQFDNCLFSLHKPQSMGRTNERDLKDSNWARMSRFRIDGVNVDHLQAATTQEGPISWITSGKFDAVVDIKFPREHADDELPLNALIVEIADAISTASQSLERIPGQRELAKPPLTVPEEEQHKEALEQMERGEGAPKVVVDIDLRFRDLKAAVPVFTNELSYVSNALVRPIVAFMNANRTLIPIRCRVIKDLSEFDGAWTLWETGLTNEISVKIYDAMAYHVSQSNPVFNRRIKTVGMWSLQKTVSAVLSTLRAIMDPMAVHLQEAYTAAADVGVPLDAVVPHT
ncbi:hypothetical protein PUNSTDRAFT_98773 [Punctularia strigosozonata HHB-11173 SS5]|uniref:uncharacterized protein n=1 Tax=Punctularia strigosozonata (strain HHB-11173) TaxID=741275 RepID=UPI000441654E|nr:uncharacterized protein PUNSTDRAFT_98773 [Punctularia strigosozonata HHB-11173 SS5]EIN11617.1 hypothetical protein PUNSTDRAFT_98773 [Punctularia strigosozonata HHB-11173 SS5]